MAEPILICTDLDRTLLPNGPQPESADARRRFRTLVEHQEIQLVYVTGRDQQLVLNAMLMYQLPQPEYVIADVGTTIYRIDADGEWTAVQEWQQQIDRNWNGYSRQQLAELIHQRDLRLQEPSKQNLHKLSYYVPLKAKQQNISAAIQTVFQQHGIQASLIWSIDEPNGIGLLDIVPASASKFHAIEFLLQWLQLNPSQCVFCGDSGNDMEVLLSPLNSVLVANSSAAIQQMARAGVSQQGLEPSLYIATGDFLGMNGFYSAGMLEGIAHFFPHTYDWMQIS
ncbi:MAG: HAD-IIB family hydrolase [Gammaproteobacteria bacterium]|nr:HAD-IIB family hydrolase [Gammaproteobacteria bacterium]MBL6999544.1 HAD-IIB family hydrolase [Gammaproteobacteria bacterium]